MKKPKRRAGNFIKAIELVDDRFEKFIIVHGKKPNKIVMSTQFYYIFRDELRELNKDSLEFTEYRGMKIDVNARVYAGFKLEWEL